MQLKTSMPLVRQNGSHVDTPPYRTIEVPNNFLAYPHHWPPYRNGGGELCDMLQGPCACGAWHQLNEWEVTS